MLSIRFELMKNSKELASRVRVDKGTDFGF